MLARVVELVVDAEAKGQVGVLGRRADQDALGAAFRQVQLGFVAAGEKAGRLQDHLHAEIFPGQIARIALLQDLNLMPADDDVLGVVPDLAIEFPVDRVPLEEMRQGLGVGEVVDGGDAFDVALVHRAQDVASDSAEAVDAVVSHR